MNKRYKTLSLLLAAILALSLLGGCGASGKSAASSSSAAYDTAYGAPAAEPAAPMAMEAASEEAAYDRGENGGISTDSAPDGQAAGEVNADKIIYSAWANIETIDYQGTVDGVYALIDRFGGFLQSSSITGTDYYTTARGGKTYRSAEFIIRIPSASFSTLTNSLSDLGNVTYCNTSAENITREYYDVQSRLTAYETQEARLLEMLEIAESVEDMLAIQQQLTEVQYNIDSLRSTLKNYDNYVNYSTVTISINEVQKYTETPEVVLSYWERMTAGFQRSLKDVGEFFTEAFLWLVSNLPVLLIVVLALAILVWVVRGLARKSRASGGERLTRAQRREARKARRLAKKNGQVSVTEKRDDSE